MNFIRIKFSGFYDLVSFGDANLSRGSHVRVEVTSSTMENEVTIFVCFPAFYISEITCRVTPP
jgi:hypothetical protein